MQELSGEYIFEILNLLDLEDRQNSESLYTNLRGIFLRTLRHDEKLALSHEDFILFYVLNILHPDLPVFIKDKYSHKMGTDKKRIYDLRSDILDDSEKFLLSSTADTLSKLEKYPAEDGLKKIDDLKMEVDYDQNEVINS